MAKIQCGKCGGIIELPDGATSGVCPRCGDLTSLPEKTGGQAGDPDNGKDCSPEKTELQKSTDAYDSIVDLIEDAPEDNKPIPEKQEDRKPASDLDRFEAKLADPGKPELRLPRMGCFLIFLIFFLMCMGFSSAYYSTVGEIPAKYSIPEERVSVTDTEGILLEEDMAVLDALAKEISKQEDCGVAVMFFDARLANMLTVFDQIAAEWAPGKGVLLICDVRNSTMRLGLIGSGWQLADWDMDTVAASCRAYRKDQRGAQAIELLTTLKHSLDTAEKKTHPVENADAAGAGKTTAASAGDDVVQRLEKSIGAMTKGDVKTLLSADDNAIKSLVSGENKPAEKDSASEGGAAGTQASAEEKAAEAKIAAEDRAAEAALDEDFDDDDESVGMRAYREKNGGKTKKGAGILFSSTVNRGGETSVRNCALFFLIATILVAVFAVKNGKKTRASDLKKNPAVLAEFRKKRGGNPALRLVDTNEYIPVKWTHKKFLRITAIVLAVLMGLSAGSSQSESVENDKPRELNELIPDYPEDGRIVDQAGVFTPEGMAKVSAAIRHLESNTGGEMIVYTVKTLNGRPIEEFSLDAAMKWKIGKKGRDDGALFVLAVDDHEGRLEIGYGWEGPINDGRAGALLRSVIPEFRNEQYAEAAVKVVRGVESYVTGVPVPASDEAGSAVPAGTPKAYEPMVRDYGVLAYEKPNKDPRVLDPADSLWGMIGILGCLIAVAAAYWGRIVMTSAPHFVIFDPTAVRVYTPSSGSGGGGSSRSSRSYSSSRSSSRSSSSSRRSSGGGGSFGGGGASVKW